MQSLLQVLTAHADSRSWEEAMAAPRWRSDSGKLLIERSHPGRQTLADLGHDIELRDDGDPTFGSMTSAGVSDGSPFALSDWRRSTWTGVA